VINRNNEKTRSHYTSDSQSASAPVTACIQFKIALLTFKTLTTHQPSYIHDLLQQHRSSQQLRSSSHNQLEIPRMRTIFAQCSFTYSAPHIRKSLLQHSLATRMLLQALSRQNWKKNILLH